MARVPLTNLFAYYMFGWVLRMVLILVLKGWLNSTHGFCILLTCQFGFINMGRNPSKNLGGILKTTHIGIHHCATILKVYMCNYSTRSVMVLEVVRCFQKLHFVLHLQCFACLLSFKLQSFKKKLQCFPFTCSFISFTSNAPFVVLRGQLSVTFLSYLHKTNIFWDVIK